MSQLVRLEGKHTTQNAHCALEFKPQPSLPNDSESLPKVSCISWIRDFWKIWVVWGLWYRRGVKATKGDSEDLLTYMSTFTCYSEYFCYTMDNTRKWCTQNFQFWVCGWDSQSLITFLYQFIVGASARTLWYWYHRLIFRTCLIPIFRANSLLPHLLQDTQEEYFFTIGIEGAPQGPERGLEDQCFSKFLDEWLPKD